jgi:guanylate kinase
LSELKRRLQGRSTDSQEVIEKRIDMAKKEIQRICEYDFLVINDNLDEAAEKLKKIALVAKEKISNDEINSFVQKWENI